MASSSSLSAPNVVLFDAFFRRADLDCDGRVSGVEAVSFFQGSGLPQKILAQIWKFANTNQSGFLGRAEFYNALKLVTVAQSKRELTPELVKNAFYGPAASMIPAPQINFAATVTPPPFAPLPNQNYFPAVAGPHPATSSAFPAYGNMMAGGPLQPPHVGGTLPTASTQEGFGFAITSSASIVAPPTWPTQSKYPTSVNDGIVASDSFFRGGDLFSTTSSQPNQDSSPHGFSSAILPVSRWNTTSDSLQSSLATHSVRPYLQQNQHASVQAPNMHSSPGLPVRLQDSASGQPQPPWPRMTQTDKQKYTNIFMEVDKDRDGKITGEQARDLFLSWALPKDVLKQVCDLSDQDNDSMLSLNEFCIALHLMERHREGHALPAVLPNNILLDLPTSGQPANLLSPVTWGNQSGVQQQQMMTGSGAQHLNPTAGWPPRPAAVPPSDEHEVEILAKKYEDKYKQVGDVSSKLTTEEATFCDIQGKKFELYQWIVKLEQDVNTDDTVQVRADRINFVLDELVKSLNEQCKKYGLRAKLTTLLELPFGWQPGIQEGAADWDEDWDELEDKEFALVKEYTLDVQNTIAHPNQKQPKAVSTKALDINSPKFVVSPKSDDKSEKPQTTNEQGVGNRSVFDKSNDGSEKSAPNSPFASSTIGSPHRDFVDSDIRKTSGEDSSPRNQNDTQETQSDHGGEKSVFSEERVFDEPNWGTFDTNDDIDSVWGFNASSKEICKLLRVKYFFSKILSFEGHISI